MTEQMSSDLTLVLFFDRVLQIAHIEDLRILAQVMKSKGYVPRSSDWFSFFDWLRTSDSVIGLRINPLSPEPIFQSLKELPYLRVGEHGEIELYFTASRNFDLKRSCDQAFGYNQLWTSSDNSVALTVTLDDCSVDERALILRYSTPLSSFKNRHVSHGD